ncbi:[4Fe-4S] proteins maturation [Coemansia sp. S610]|uniref:[4Fe-4S] proteins maturation n=1 Tax=Coemansia linderi TaxID=2663919 RepID=A0ACC1KGS3_9FUNG|nr:[4Fe-4S] proteins maturation [Coemansia sp. S85]KAJ2026990.1 [4Fe-4S] proteins maturation [Coemansia sp. S610]KAJ2417111.1 [4Fe-4S] proteins maturation [Coemansia sp. RSA 2530]KAJ2700613.1 [4Fe-4S] proteins maturation [Coemansia sp. IMI 209128]KAJ2789480.1 [4Fe-4S] proteins maturation [Coemansia linderi]
MNSLVPARTLWSRHIGKCLALRLQQPLISASVISLRSASYGTATSRYTLPKLSDGDIAALAGKVAGYTSNGHQTSTSPTPATVTGTSDAITLTDSAIRRLRYLSEKRDKTQYLRLRVDSGGCYGFSYMLDMTEEPEVNDIIVDRKGAKMVVDDVSLPLVTGATIDWQDRLIGQAFVVLANPNASGGCGCGASFEIKLD